MKFLEAEEFKRSGVKSTTRKMEKKDRGDDGASDIMVERFCEGSRAHTPKNTVPSKGSLMVTRI